VLDVSDLPPFFSPFFASRHFGLRRRLVVDDVCSGGDPDDKGISLAGACPPPVPWSSEPFFSRPPPSEGQSRTRPPDGRTKSFYFRDAFFYSATRMVGSLLPFLWPSSRNPLGHLRKMITALGKSNLFFVDGSASRFLVAATTPLGLTADRHPGALMLKNDSFDGFFVRIRCSVSQETSSVSSLQKF